MGIFARPIGINHGNCLLRNHPVPLSARDLRPGGRREQRCGELPLVGRRRQGGALPCDHVDRGHGHSLRSADVQRHDGDRPPRNLPPRAILLSGACLHLPGRDGHRRARARRVQHAGPADLDHRIDGIRIAGRYVCPHAGEDGRDRRHALRRLPQYGEGPFGHHGHLPLGGDRLLFRHGRAVARPSGLYVPLPGAAQVDDRPVRRYRIDCDRLLHADQGRQGHNVHDLRGQGVDRRPRHPDRRLLPGGLHPADAGAALAAGQCLQGGRPARDLRPGPGLCRQRPGQFHRSAAGRLRLLSGLCGPTVRAAIPT